jgi:hypothetical protein
MGLTRRGSWVDTVAVGRAIDNVNAQIDARNRAERDRHVTNPLAFRPLVDRRKF